MVQIYNSPVQKHVKGVRRKQVAVLAAPHCGEARRQPDGTLFGNISLNGLCPRERDFFIDNLLVRIHLIIEMILVDRPCAMGFWLNVFSLPANP